MRLLLDTHTSIWYDEENPRLSRAARPLIEDPEHEKFVSPARLWEIAIKMSRGYYLLNVPYPAFIQGAISDNGFTVLAVEPRQTAALIAPPHHRKDPFDRLPTAQAIIENMPLLSVDARLDAHPITRL